MILRSVSLSTLTRIADSHLRASSVADVPDMAMSRMPPASTWVMLRAVVGEDRKEPHQLLDRVLRVRLVSGESPTP